MWFPPYRSHNNYINFSVFSLHVYFHKLLVLKCILNCAGVPWQTGADIILCFEPMLQIHIIEHEYIESCKLSFTKKFDWDIIQMMCIAFYIERYEIYSHLLSGNNRARTFKQMNCTFCKWPLIMAFFCIKLSIKSTATTDFAFFANWVVKRLWNNIILDSLQLLTIVY